MRRSHPEIHTPPANPSPDGLTVEGLTDLYLASDKFKAGREATRDQFRRIVCGEIKPALGSRALATIAPGDLADWAQGIIDRGAPVTANQSFKILRLVWNWGRKRLVRHGVPPFPLAGFGKPWHGERPRKWHLSPDLLRTFVEAIDEEPRMTAVWWLLMLFNLTGTYNDALVWAYFKQKREALNIWHEHLNKKILRSHLVDHIRQAVDGKKQFEEAMRLNTRRSTAP